MPANRAASPFDAPQGEAFAAAAGSGAAWAEAARAHGVTAIVIDTRAATTKDALLGALGRGLRFPDYFRRNWDAFEECLTDLAWVDGKRLLIHIGPLGALAHSEPASVETLVAIARDAIATHGQHGRMVWVGFELAGPLAGLRELQTPR